MEEKREQETTLSRKQAAEYAGVHYNTIRQWERRGRVTTIREVRNGVEEVRIPKAEVDEIISNREDEALVWIAPKLKERESQQLWAEAQRLQQELAEKIARIAELEEATRQQQERIAEYQGQLERLLDKVLGVE